MLLRSARELKKVVIGYGMKQEEKAVDDFKPTMNAAGWNVLGNGECTRFVNSSEPSYGSLIFTRIGKVKYW